MIYIIFMTIVLLILVLKGANIATTINIKSVEKKILQELDNYAVIKYGYKKNILLAQMLLETGHGKKVIDKNIFNIKWYKDCGFDYVEVRTVEFVDGKKIYVNARFKKYNSYYEAIDDYINLMRKDRYKNAWNNRQNALKYFQGLIYGGYATDINYVNKLMNIYNGLG